MSLDSLKGLNDEVYFYEGARMGSIDVTLIIDVF